MRGYGHVALPRTRPVALPKTRPRPPVRSIKGKTTQCQPTCTTEGRRPSIIAGRKVAILGYGSQGHAHALNLKDSGVDVRVGLREGSSSAAKADGGRAPGGRRRRPPSAEADVIMILLPDTEIAPVYDAEVAPEPVRRRRAVLRPRLQRPLRLTCKAPPASTSPWSPRRAPGTSCAAPTPRVAACRASSPWSRTPPARPRTLALSYADAIGGTRAGVLETTFEEETETDLFGEQVVLCGGLSALVQAGFETLVDAGYQPESAYFECLHELKLIVDLMYEQGISGMRYSISDTAEYGDVTRGPRIINDRRRRRDAQDPRRDHERRSSPRSWSARATSGRRQLRGAARAGQGPPDRAGRRRAAGMMPWISAGKQKVADASGG